MIGNSQAEKSVPPALSPPYDRRVKRSNAASVLVCSVFAEACEHSIVMRDALGWNGLDYVPMFDNHAVFHAEQAGHHSARIGWKPCTPSRHAHYCPVHFPPFVNTLRQGYKRPTLRKVFITRLKNPGERHESHAAVRLDLSFTEHCTCSGL